jgi:hypothetical protein
VGSQTAKKRWPPWWEQLEGYMELRGTPTQLKCPENGTRHTRSSHHIIQVTCRAPGAQRLWVTRHWALRMGGLQDCNKSRPKLDGGKGTSLYGLSPKIAKRGDV